MAVSGMTGFGRSEGAFANLRFVWEARSVNGRTLDVKARLPAGLEALEPAVRDAAAARFKRGSVQVGLTIRREADPAGSVRLDAALVERLVQAGRPYVESGLAAPPRWDGLLALRGVLVAEDAQEEAAEERATRDAALVAALVEAFDALAAARRQEGATLSGVLGGLTNRILDLTAEAATLAGLAAEGLAEKIKARLAALSGEMALDPQRIAQEAALIASKIDVREEIDRLAAHAKEAHALLLAPEPAGRRLDFLAQELGREANTLTSKSTDLALTRVGLELKLAVDQFKEQAANVE